MIRLLAALVALQLALPAAAFDPPSEITLQGQLQSPDGQPLPGPVNIQVRIYENEDPVGGEQPLYIEDFMSEPLRDGVFSVVVGRNPLAGMMGSELFGDPDRFVEVSVNGETLSPRMPLTTVPYAFQAGPTGRSGPRVFDAAGTSLGELATGSLGGSFLEVFTGNGVILRLSPFSGDLVAFGSALFESADCSGQPYLVAGPGRIDGVAATRVGPDVVVFRTGAVQTITANATGLSGNCTASSPTVFDAVAAERITPTELGFSLPVSVPLAVRAAQ